MEAIDATYQTQELPIESEKVINNKNDPFFESELSLRENEGEISFEKLIDAICDDSFGVPIEEDENLLTRDVSLLKQDIVADGNINSLKEAKNKKNIISKCKNDKKVEDSFKFADASLMEDIPFVDIEIEVPTYNIEKKEIKKNVKQDFEKIEKKETSKKELVLEENGIASEKTVQHLLKNKKENPKRTEKKKEENVKVDAKMEAVDASFLQKQKRASPKKLPIVVEDYRTSEQEVDSDMVGGGYENAESDFRSYSGYADDSQEVFSRSYDVGVASEHAEGAGDGHFSSILAEQIKASSAEIVERGKIVLRDGDIGEIRLQLKPEHLGSVHIQLKLNEQKKLQGDVIVSSKEAYDAFDAGMGELLASFRDAGFDASSFNLNWKGDRRDDGLREDLVERYFSPEKTHLTLSEKLKVAENKYRAGQAETLNVLV